MPRKQWYKQRKDAQGEVLNKTIMANDTPDSAEALEKDGWNDKRPKDWVDPPDALGGETKDLADALAKNKLLEEQIKNMQDAVPMSKRALVEQVAELQGMIEKEAEVNAELVAKIKELTAPAPDEGKDGDPGDNPDA